MSSLYSETFKSSYMIFFSEHTDDKNLELSYEVIKLELIILVMSLLLEL